MLIVGPGLVSPVVLLFLSCYDHLKELDGESNPLCMMCSSFAVMR